jgi:hypothetical protein
MSHCLAAEIFIGGDVPASAVPELCMAIRNERLSLTWGGAWFEPNSASELLEARQEHDGELLLRLCHDEVRWGEFDELEPVLQEHGASYTRRTESRGEREAERVEYRPGMDAPVCVITDAGFDPIVPASELVAVETPLAEAIERLDADDTTVARDLAEKALHALRTQLPPSLPPLGEFSITHKEHRKPPDGKQLHAVFRGHSEPHR